MHVLARRDWAPALTRDGLERTDILAVHTDRGSRRLVEIQVKTARGATWKHISWLLGTKSQAPSEHAREYCVLVAVPQDVSEHMHWLTEPGVRAGTRNAGVDRARVKLSTFGRYEDRWDLLEVDEPDAPVLLPEHYRGLAQEDRVGLPEGHAWRKSLPEW